MRYGELELAYAQPIANALVNRPDFRAWVLSRSPFHAWAASSRVLVDEMVSRRAKTSQTWWRSHFAEKCRCAGCAGQETDILAILESIAGERFAVHFEVKQPTDRFPSEKDQATNYRLRAACWVANPPSAVVPHSAAATGLLYSVNKRREYGASVSKFDFAITFEMIRDRFPEIPLPPPG